MTILSDSVLVESKSARNNQLARLSHDSALEIISRAKGLLVALWQGTGVTTTEEIARYYEVESSVVRHAIDTPTPTQSLKGWDSSFNQST